MNMQIRAKTNTGRVVTIIAFVSRYNNTYAVTILPDGRLEDYPIENLTVIDTHR